MISDEIEGATDAELTANLKNVFSQGDESMKICSKAVPKR